MSLYDSVPYPRHAYGFTHPDWLATLATLHGLEPRPIERARILELGCASGSNLVPMAYALPDAELIGVDLSTRQISEGRKFATALGLRNIRLDALDLTTIDDRFGRFDYIIAHGVYSWVPPDVQDAVLRICEQRLSDSGVALVSYNALPGCHLRQMVRAMGQFHTRDLTDPRERADQLRAMVRLLVASTRDDGSSYPRILRSEADRLDKLSDEFLLHDVLEEANFPCYFHEFVARAGSHNLQFVCEALPVDRRGLRLSPDVLETMRREYDPIELEQHLDFLDGTAFRRSLLCRAGNELKRDLGAAPLERLLIASPARPVSASPDLKGEQPEEFTHRKDRFTASIRCDRPIEKVALAILGEAFPHAMPLDALIDAAAARLGRQPDDRDRRELRELVLGGFPVGVIELHRWQSPAVCTVNPCPEVSPVARYEISQGWDATTLWHERLALSDPLARELIVSLDGRNDRATLVERLVRALAAHEAKVGGNAPRRPESELRDEVLRRLEPALADLARAAVLVG